MTYNFNNKKAVVRKRNVKLINARIIKGSYNGQKLTQKYIAELVGVDDKTYWGYENGLRNPSRKAAMKIAEILDITVDDIFQGGEAGNEDN